jgi:hypothetical protein
MLLLIPTFAVMLVLLLVAGIAIAFDNEDNDAPKT